jgi:hypothetical protein
MGVIYCGDEDREMIQALGILLLAIRRTADAGMEARCEAKAMKAIRHALVGLDLDLHCGNWPNIAWQGAVLATRHDWRS